MTPARCWLLLAAWPAAAHVVSMSSSDLAITGARAHYELRMPQYEITHVASPERVLLEHVRFSSGGRQPKILGQNCAIDASGETYVCKADLEFPAPVEKVDIECTLAGATVANHVHLLRASMDGKRDQAVFDLAFTRATLRFRPPTAAEIAATQSAAGFARAWGGAAQVLFLAALALAARSRRELAALAGMFVAGQAACVFLVARTTWEPAPRFVEAAAALTVAYLAVEILLLPKAGARWIVAGVLGVFHGLYFYLFVQTTGYERGWVLLGAALAEVIAIAVLALALKFATRWAKALRPVQVSASALLVFGMVWFFLRLRG